MEKKEFTIQIHTLDHYSWQGVLREEAQAFSFQSERELLQTIHRLLEEAAQEAPQSPAPPGAGKDHTVEEG